MTVVEQMLRCTSLASDRFRAGFLFLACLTVSLLSFSQQYSTVVHINGEHLAFKNMFVDSVSFDRTEDVPEDYFVHISNVVNYDSLFLNTGFINSFGIVNGFIGSFGNVSQYGENCTYTDPISIEGASEISVYALMKNRAGGGVCFYNQWLQFISSIFNIDNGNLYDSNNYRAIITRSMIPQNAKYIRVQSGSDGQGKVSVTYQNENVRLSTNSHDESVYMQTCVSLAPGECLKLPVNNIKKNTQLIVNVNGGDNVPKVKFGRGEGKYEGCSIEIDKDSLYLFRSLLGEELIGEYRHGFAGSRSLTAIVDFPAGNEASLVLLGENGKVYNSKIAWWAAGAPYLKNIGETEVFATVTFYAKDVSKPVWFFADSYFNWRAPMYWPYYVYRQEYSEWFADHRSGEASSEAIQCVENDLRMGTPQYAVWCLGMNDSSDQGVPAPKWLKAVTRFLELCEERSIIPILSTIPSVPGRNHKEKNAWVRNSGYRYIDFAEAVELDGNGKWKEGLLSSDNVHPTKAGAQALANQVLADFPEMELTKKRVQVLP